MKSEEKLKELNASKDKFFSIIAHDLKSPFQGFLNLSRLISSEYKYLSEKELTDLISELNISAEQLYKLIENLLHWSRIQRGIIQFQPDSFNLNKIVQMNMDLFTDLARQKQVHIINNINENINVYADLNMVDTILRNLISNAIKFSYQNSQILIHSELINSLTIVVSVKDFGVGIPKDVIREIFKIDSNITTLGTAQEKGTGLGLILCKELVEKHKGKIWVKSQSGSGSTFYFTLPISSQV